MQEVKRFVCGVDSQTTTFNAVPVEAQINEFLANNRNYTAKSINIIIGASYKEAFVIFDVYDPEAKKNKFQNETKKKSEVINNG